MQYVERSRDLDMKKSASPDWKNWCTSIIPQFLLFNLVLLPFWGHIIFSVLGNYVYYVTPDLFNVFKWYLFCFPSSWVSVIHSQHMIEDNH